MSTPTALGSHIGGLTLLLHWWCPRLRCHHLLSTWHRRWFASPQAAQLALHVLEA